MAFERLACLAAFALLLIGCAQTAPPPQYGQAPYAPYPQYPQGTPNGQWVPPQPNAPYAPYPLPPPQGFPPPPSVPPQAPQASDGQRIVVTPVFYVPSDVSLDPQTEARAAGLVATHLQIAQRRYQTLLGDTFVYAMEQPLTYHSPLSTQELEASRPDTAHEMTRELLAWRREDRSGSHHVFVALLVRAPGQRCGRASRCLGGGRTFNGAPGSGGGFIQMEFNNLLDGRFFQSTLIHELGHAFGLSHADCHGEDMHTGRSIMGYNPAHHSTGFQESADPGVFTDEDVVTLALNRAAFPRLAVDPSVAARRAHPLYKANGECWLGPMGTSIGPLPGFRGF